MRFQEYFPHRQEPETTLEEALDTAEFIGDGTGTSSTEILTDRTPAEMLELMDGLDEGDVIVATYGADYGSSQKPHKFIEQLTPSDNGLRFGVRLYPHRDDVGVITITEDRVMLTQEMGQREITHLQEAPDCVFQDRTGDANE